MYQKIVMTSPSTVDPLSKGFGLASAKSAAFSAVRRLWKIRQREGMTQQDIAARLGRDPGWVSRKLSGPSNWTIATLGEIADALDGEIEIKIADLHKPTDMSNSDAYSGYGEQPPIRIGVQPSKTYAKIINENSSKSTANSISISSINQ